MKYISGVFVTVANYYNYQTNPFQTPNFNATNFHYHLSIAFKTAFLSYYVYLITGTITDNHDFQTLKYISVN